MGGGKGRAGPGDRAGHGGSGRRGAGRHGERPELDRMRVFALSDGVFAIAATLLALELRVPDGLSPEALREALGGLGTEIRGVLISYLVIGLLWLSHHATFHRIQRITPRVGALNVLLLGLVAVLPFPSSLLSSYTDPIVVIIFAVDVGAVALMQVLVLAVGWAEGTLTGGLSLPLVVAPSLVTAAVFAVSIPIALVSAEAATYSWLLLLPLEVLLGRLSTRAHRAAARS